MSEATVAVNTEPREATWIEKFQYQTKPVLVNSMGATGVVGRALLIEGPQAFWAAFTAKDSTAPKRVLLIAADGSKTWAIKT